MAIASGKEHLSRIWKLREEVFGMEHESIYDIRWYDEDEEESYRWRTVTMTESEVNAYVARLNAENGEPNVEYYSVIA